jgi:hypothetical protein
MIPTLAGAALAGVALYGLSAISSQEGKSFMTVDSMYQPKGGVAKWFAAFERGGR